ncbi:hypothetical protein BJY01DRAFT_211204 [Aspergillus pseudoustus]|uniref:Secreted protein n=1 Tax=Aspergillus pseudoustus TaxID=1810923 RepID=A0ABR4KAA6_9EURO
MPLLSHRSRQAVLSVNLIALFYTLLFQGQTPPTHPNQSFRPPRLRLGHGFVQSLIVSLDGASILSLRWLVSLAVAVQYHPR